MEDDKEVQVVLEITPRFIRAGIAGDPVPLVVCFSAGSDDQESPNWESSDSETSSRFIDHVTETPLTSEQIMFNDIESKDRQHLFFHSETVPERYGPLVKTLDHIFYRLMSLNTKSQRYRVILVETCLLPTPIKRQTTMLLFQNWHFPYIQWISEPLLCCIGAGVTTGIVVNIGWENITVTPIFEMYSISQLFQSSKRAGGWLHYRVLEYLLRNQKIPNSVNRTKLVDNLIQSFYVDPRDNYNDETPFTLKFANNGLEVANSVRHEFLDQMFFSDDGDVDELPIQTLMKNCILRSPLDCRSELLNNIIITGMYSHLPGLKSKLISKLQETCPNQSFRLIKSVGSWASASLYCSTTNVSSNDLKRDRFLNNEQKIQDSIIDHLETIDL